MRLTGPDLRPVLVAIACVACSAADVAPPPASITPAPVIVTRDLAYGKAPAERLDVYAARPGGAAAPIVIFVHGGAYMYGDKNQKGGVWGNVAMFFARAGYVAINADYRLAPGSVWPAGARDVALMVAWAHAHGPAFGGDPARIVLIGHSAGATHVAGYVFDRRFQPASGPGIAGAALISGRYTLGSDPHDVNGGRMQSYFGTDQTRWPDRAPIAHLAAAPYVPLLIATAARENRDLDVGAADLFDAVCHRDQHCPRAIQLQGETHMSEMKSVGTQDTTLSTPLLDFVAGVTRR